MELTELRCKACGARMADTDLDMSRGVARCSHCKAVFGLTDSAPGDRSGSHGSFERTEVPMPKGIEIRHVGAGLQITRRWYTLILYPLLLFCIVWNGFVINWHVTSLGSGLWFLSFFGLLHTAVGIGLAYYVLAGFLNRTTVLVDKGVLQVRHRPVPWWGNKDIQADNIDQIYCKQKRNYEQSGSRMSQTGSVYEVHAILRHGPKEKLVSGLMESEQALYIEQELERYLGIRDRHVRGELGR